MAHLCRCREDKLQRPHIFKNLLIPVALSILLREITPTQQVQLSHAIEKKAYWATVVHCCQAEQYPGYKNSMAKIKKNTWLKWSRNNGKLPHPMLLFKVLSSHMFSLQLLRLFLPSFLCFGKLLVSDLFQSPVVVRQHVLASELKRRRWFRNTLQLLTLHAMAHLQTEGSI